MRHPGNQRNGWTTALLAVGAVSAAAVGQADETLHPVMTTLQSTTIGGYVDTSAIVNFGRGNAVVGRSFDGTDKQDGFNLNAVKLVIEKPLDDAQWSAGYHVGLLFGPDANTLAATSSTYANSDFAVKNAYVSLRAPVGNGLEFKMGVWDTLIGYEVLEAGNNPNYSRSFGYYLEPIIHTGLLASYEVNEVLSVAAGIANRADVNTINARWTSVESLESYLASITLTAPESAGFLQGAKLFAGVVDQGIPDAPDVMNLYVGALVPTPITNVSVGAAYDYRGRGEGEGFSSSYANAVAGYLTWQLSEKLKLAARGEYAWGTTGTWYTTIDENNELLGVTATLDYSLWANVVSRVEFRWDHDLTGTGVFNDGTDENSVSLALNVIYQF